jgi:hypothetical protein
MYYHEAMTETSKYIPDTRDEIWINEGLSVFSQIYYGDSEVDTFNMYGLGSLFEFNKDRNETVPVDYRSAGYFVTYLYSKYGEDILRLIPGDKDAVAEIEDHTGKSIEELIREAFIANVVNSYNSPSYSSDLDLKTFADGKYYGIDSLDSRFDYMKNHLSIGGRSGVGLYESNINSSEVNHVGKVGRAQRLKIRKATVIKLDMTDESSERARIEIPEDAESSVTFEVIKIES